MQGDMSETRSISPKQILESQNPHPSWCSLVENNQPKLSTENERKLTIENRYACKTPVRIHNGRLCWQMSASTSVHIHRTRIRVDSRQHEIEIGDRGARVYRWIVHVQRDIRWKDRGRRCREKSREEFDGECGVGERSEGRRRRWARIEGCVGHLRARNP